MASMYLDRITILPPLLILHASKNLKKGTELPPFPNIHSPNIDEEMLRLETNLRRIIVLSTESVDRPALTGQNFRSQADR